MAKGQWWRSRNLRATQAADEAIRRAWRDTWATSIKRPVASGAPITATLVGILNGLRTVVSSGEPIGLEAVGSIVLTAGITALIALAGASLLLFLFNAVAAPYRLRDDACQHAAELLAEAQQHAAKLESDLAEATGKLRAIEAQKASLRILFRSGEHPFEYVSKKDTDSQFSEWEDWRAYYVGVEAIGKTVDDVQVLLMLIEGVTSDNQLVADGRPGALILLDRDDSGPVSVHPGADGITYFEVVRKNASHTEQIRIACGREVSFVGKSQFIPPGEYVFTLGVRARDGVEVSGPRRFRVAVDLSQPGFDSFGRLLFEPLDDD